VLEDRTGSDANPALLCYVRKGRNLVDTLHREILELNLLGPEMEETKGDSSAHNVGL
jgi:ubiquitin carboxyl-terminal hydrolase 25/28